MAFGMLRAWEGFMAYPKAQLAANINVPLKKAIPLHVPEMAAEFSKSESVRLFSSWVRGRQMDRPKSQGSNFK